MVVERNYYSAFRSIVHPWNRPTNFNIFTLEKLENDYFDHFYSKNHVFDHHRIMKYFNFVPKTSQKMAKIAIFMAYFQLSILLKLLVQVSDEIESRSYIFLASQTLLYKLEKLDFEKIILNFSWELHLRVHDTSERTVAQSNVMIGWNFKNVNFYPRSGTYQIFRKFEIDLIHFLSHKI